MSVSTGRETPRIAVNSLVLIVAQVAGLAAQAASVLLIARGLGPTGLGQFSYVSLATLVGGTFVEFGLDTLLVRDAARSPGAGGRLLVETVAARLPLALTVVGFLWLVPPPLQGITPETALALRIYSLVLIVGAVAGAAEALVRAQERMTIVAATNAAVGALRVAGIATVLALGGGITGLAAVMVAAGLAEMVFYLSAAWRSGLRWRDLSRPSARAIAARLRRTAPFAVAGLGGIVHLHGDVFVLGLLLGASPIGTYRAAKGILDSCRLLPNAAFGALYPAIARLSRAPEPAGPGQMLLRQTVTAVGAASLAGAVVLSLGAEPLIGLLYGPRYQASAPVLRWLGPTLVPLAANTLIAAHLFASGRASKVAAVSLLGAAATVGLNALLASSSGLVGAAGATLLAELMMSILYAPDLAHSLGLHPRFRRLLPPRRLLSPLLIGGSALAGTLWFLLLPVVFRRYADRQPLAGFLDSRSLSLLSLGLNLGVLALLALARRGSRPTPDRARDRGTE